MHPLIAVMPHTEHFSVLQYNVNKMKSAQMARSHSPLDWLVWKIWRTDYYAIAMRDPYARTGHPTS